MKENASILASLSLLTGYERGVLAGIYSYVLPKNNWTIYVINPDDPNDRLPADVTIEGIIGRFHGNVRPAVEALGVPTVITASGYMDLPQIPRVIPDNHLIGRAAAEYLLPLGMRQFAYIGAPMAFALYRLNGFRDTLAATGNTVHVYPGGDSELGWWEPQRKHVGLPEWIKKLPKPVGIFCARDLVALGVTEICKQEGLRIPQDVALIGVDNDDLLCRMCDPALTSIISPAQEIGYRAAATVDAWLGGQPPQRPVVAVPHAGIAERASTNVSHISDPVVQQAIGYIRGHLSEPFLIDDVTTALGVRRRTLERKFRSTLDRSIHDEIQRARTDRAKELLTHTDLPLKAVARKSGFAAPERFFVVFRQMTGQTPHAYRVRFRGEGAVAEAVE